MANTYTLKIDIQTYWHAGTGRGRSYEIDSVVHRDRDGLPALPGRSVKGLLRDAVAGAAALNWYGNDRADIVTRLFGPLGVEGAETHEGWLKVSDATLPADIRGEIKAKPALRANLFTNLFSTAIKHERGSAADKTLRGTEVAVPMTLFASITIDPNANLHAEKADAVASKDALAWLTNALPLARGLGSHRHRGMGRATFTISEVTK